MKNMLAAERNYNLRNFQKAIEIFRKSIDKLENMNLKDDEEEKKINEILIKMYQNVSLCYNKTNQPEKTCLMIRELERLTSITGNVKALYAKGFANMMLDNFTLARKCLGEAEKIMPELKNISATLRELDQRESRKTKYRAEQDQALKKIMLEMQREIEENFKNVKTKRQQQEELDEFERKVEKLVIDFKNNKTVERMTWSKDIELDSRLKIEVLEQLCKKHQLHLKGFQTVEGGKTIYYMCKKD